MSTNNLFLITILIVIVIIVFIFTYPNITLSERIQFSILIILTATMIVFIAQLRVFREDTNLRQRPFVGLSEITANFLGDKLKQEDLDEKDEIAFHFKFENTGLSTARVDHVKLKMFYGIFSSQTIDNAGKIKPQLTIVDMLRDPRKEISLKEIGVEVPAQNRRIYNNIILLPHQSTIFQWIINALHLRRNLYGLKPSRPAPICVETEIKYSDLKGTPYYHHSRYFLYWPPAVYNQIFAHLHISREKEEPLHLSVQTFHRLMTEHFESH